MGENRLTILIRSFSYKQNTLIDATGHGIGFVFDMRGIDNPGRKEGLKNLSGLDHDVKEFLSHTMMNEYLDHVCGLLDITVQNYLERGFSALTVNFGCTGGQHRSVYAAQMTSDYLLHKYPIDVNIQHLNQANWLR